MPNDPISAALPPPAPASSDELRTFLRDYRTALSHADREPDSPLDSTLSSVMLSEALLRFQAIDPRNRPLNLAVLGPTQTGKSTVVNIFLGQDRAAVSPLAGFTIQPQGFWIGADSTTEWKASILPGWPRVVPCELTREPLEQVGFEHVAGPAVPELSPLAEHGLVIWDTPDFDSLFSRQYRAAVLEIGALADAIVLVVSKEKYADLTVWEVLKLLSGVGTPLLICLNKLSSHGREEITSSMRRRLDELGPWGRSIPIEPLPYIDGLGDEAPRPFSEFTPLRSAAGVLLQRGAAVSKPAALHAWLTRDWPALVAPLQAEHETMARWRQAYATAIAVAVEQYRRDFLDNEQRYDSFRRATLELLGMLELPGIGVAIGKLRNFVSIPARRLYAWSRSVSQLRSEPRPVVFGEEQVLKHLIDRLLTSLEHTAVDHADQGGPGSGLWRVLAARLRRERPELQSRFEQAAAAHVAGFADEIHAAANQLHSYLRQRPQVLNSLRAGRAFTDFASIAIAVKTGGAVVTDLLLAPALFSVTSWLTEGALGAYMKSTAAELKERQFRLVCERLFDGLFAADLAALAGRLDDRSVLGLNEARLAAATRALAEWKPA